MIEFFSTIFTSFLLGVLTPLTAVCVLPLYPAFLVYLSNQVNKNSDNWTMFKLSMIIVFGATLFMFLLGLVFTLIFNTSLTNVIGIISPIAFGFLFLVSLGLILNFDFSKYLPKPSSKVKEGKPMLSAFLYGFFFGAIVVPCNPLFIAALIARMSTVSTIFSGILGFISFGLGIGLPLIVFALISSTSSRKIIGFFAKNKKKINLISGLIMMGISFYYLVFVFRIFG